MGDEKKPGFTQIPNDQVEALAKAKLGQYEWQVLWCLIRKTYGWRKDSDQISASQIAKATGIDRRHASRARKGLAVKKMTIEDGDTVKLNPDVSAWGCASTGTGKCASRGTPTKSGCASTGTVSVPPEAQGGASTGTVSVPPEAQGGVPPEAPQKKHLKKRKEITTKKVKETSAGGKKPPRSNGKTPPPTAATWEAYSAAYTERYGVEPIRNATVNGQLAKFVSRVPKDLAPLVAAYYVGLNTKWYVQKGHSVGMMLADTEKLVTECRTNTRITESGARRADQTEERLGVFNRLLEKHRAKKHEI